MITQTTPIPPASTFTPEPVTPASAATAPKAAAADVALYELLALVDGVRVGSGKERRLCAEALEQRVMGSVKSDMAPAFAPAAE